MDDFKKVHIKDIEDFDKQTGPGADVAKIAYMVGQSLKEPACIVLVCDDLGRVTCSASVHSGFAHGIALAEGLEDAARKIRANVVPTPSKAH